MTIGDIITQAKELAGSAVSDATALSFLNEIEGQIALEWIGADAWHEYTEDDLTSDPLIPPPWGRGIFVPYVEAMIYYSHGEFDRYANAKALHEQNWLDFRKHVRRTLPYPCCCGNRYREEDPLNV